MPASSIDAAALAELEQTLHREMPICAAMSIRSVEWREGRLSLAMPLEPNRNHQYSAFAGSLNALCTIAGWGVAFLLLRSRGLTGNIVIRRGEIRYLRPVRSPQIVARTLPIDAAAEEFFFEFLQSQGQSKLAVSAEIVDDQGALVRFSGAYVVQGGAAGA